MKFTRQEETNDEGFVINYTKDDGVIAWFETKAKAGANSKGEVRLKYKGDIEVKDSGYFRFTKKPEFYNESALTGNDYDWIESIGLVEGISWEHGDARKTKWNGEINIPQKYLKERGNLYTACGKSIKIDFLYIRPRLEYSYKNKRYTYQWEGFCYETPYLGNEALQWTTININNPDDVAKIKGTWTQSDEWDEAEHFLANVHEVYNETLIIDNTNVKNSWSCTYTKLNGSAFTKEEIIDGFCYYELSNNLPENYFHHEVGEFHYDLEGGGNPNSTMYTHKIYQLRFTVELSNDWRTITEKNERTELLSKFFGNHNAPEHNDSRTVELKLSKDESQLYIFWTYKNDNDYDEWAEADVYTRR